MNKELAYFAARHFHPEIIRLARAALDVGVSVDVVLKAAHNDTIRGAIEYMSANPLAGRVVWVDARRYTWKDLQESAFVELEKLRAEKAACWIPLDPAEPGPNP